MNLKPDRVDVLSSYDINLKPNRVDVLSSYDNLKPKRVDVLSSYDNLVAAAVPPTPKGGCGQQRSRAWTC